jgi:hypothetical protein
MIAPGLYKVILHKPETDVFWYFHEDTCYVWKIKGTSWDRLDQFCKSEDWSDRAWLRGCALRKDSMIVHLWNKQELRDGYVELIPSCPLEFVLLTGKAYNPPIVE